MFTYPLVVWILFGFDSLWANMGEQIYQPFTSKEVCEASAALELAKAKDRGKTDVHFKCVQYNLHQP
jgi:hypothetical protein